MSFTLRRRLPGMDSIPGMTTSHHNGAIEMADEVLGTTSDPDVKAFAQQVVAAQTAEVSRLQKILDRL